LSDGESPSLPTRIVLFEMTRVCLELVLALARLVFKKISKASSDLYRAELLVADGVAS
jgi:hypothetical protein